VQARCDYVKMSLVAFLICPCHTQIIAMILQKRKRQQGFTLTELLIVVSIIVLLLLFLLINLKTQILRARDAQRKADLGRIQKSFEEYFNDKQCYPYAEVLESCGGDNLSPYIKRVPCDPVTKDPYLYVPGAPSLCGGYRVCAQLEDKTDADIARIGCHPDNGCGFGAGYNYCVSVGYSITPEGFDPNASPTPTPTPLPEWDGPYACTPSGSCNYYGDPTDPIFPQYGCPVSWTITCPTNACADPTNRCAI
jgi:general secretion pathway protein G